MMAWLFTPQPRVGLALAVVGLLIILLFGKPRRPR